MFDPVSWLRRFRSHVIAAWARKKGAPAGPVVQPVEPRYLPPRCLFWVGGAVGVGAGSAEKWWTDEQGMLRTVNPSLTGLEPVCDKESRGETANDLPHPSVVVVEMTGVYNQTIILGGDARAEGGDWARGTIDGG